MSQQPVTPDREALIEATAMALHQACVAHWGRLEAINERYRIEITRHGVDAHDGSAALAVDALLPLLTEALDRAEKRGERRGREQLMAEQEAEAAEFMANLKAGQVRLAGPNRKDEESAEVWTEAPDHASYQDVYPWSQCRDVDPFTGQPEQHEHGDACEGNCE